MGKYWFQQLYYDRSPGFWHGVREGITAYAIWKDGTRVVGCMERPIKEVMEEIGAAEKWSQHGRTDW